MVEVKTTCRIHDSRAACHIAGCCHRANSVACNLRATYHIAGWCHLVNFRATCHITGCSHLAKSMSGDHATLQGVIIPSTILKIVYRHILFFLFLMEFGLWRAAAFVSSPIHLFTDATQIFPSMQRHLVPVKLHAFHGLRNVLPNFCEFIGYCCTALFVISVLPRRSCVIVAVCLFVCLSLREQDNSQTHLPNTAVMTQGDPVEVITLCCSSGSGYACMNQFFTFFKIGR